MEERLYDLIFIVRPDTPETDIDKLVTTIEHSIADKGAKIEKMEKWGRKRMAYRVKKLREGFYVYFALRSSNGDLIKELERRLRVNDAVIKYLTVRLDEDMKRKEKFNKKRERRAARHPLRCQAPRLRLPIRLCRQRLLPLLRKLLPPELRLLPPFRLQLQLQLRNRPRPRSPEVAGCKFVRLRPAKILI